MANYGVTLTYLNIRQSITILLAKLVLIDVILAGIVVSLYFLFVQGEAFAFFVSQSTIVFLCVFGVIGFFKIFFTFYIVLQWLNEYYEITPEHIVHKSGVIFRKTEEYRIDNIRSMDIEDTFLGELFNFGTITLFDTRLKKYLDMYMIHNPRRYAAVLQSLRPKIEYKKQDVRIPFVHLEKERG